MNIPETDKSTVWRRLAIVTVLLCLLVGPNFGPIPTLLSQRLSIEASVVALIVSFWIGFSIIIAVILRMSGGVSLRELVRSLGLGAPSRVAANIAEGKGRFSKKEFVRYLYVSRGSLYETMTLLEVFRRKRWISDDRYSQLELNGKEIASIIKGLINSISNLLFFFQL